MNREDIQFPSRHNPLREDIHALGAVMGELLREQGGDELFALVEMDRQTALRRRAGAVDCTDLLTCQVRGRPPQLARDLVRAFSAWFQLANVAEKVHRMRRRRQYFQEDSGRPQPGGVEDALAALKAQGLGLEQVLGLLGQLRIEPVLIAHPTESTRRTMLRRQQRMAALLLEHSNLTLAPHERRSLLERIRVEMTTEWQTEEHPRERLTVADEREHAIFYLAEVLYRIVPAFYQEIAEALVKLYGTSFQELELPVLLRFGTWVGGDMETSVDVHAKSIRETLQRQQQVILSNYFAEIQQLAQLLSQSASRVGVSPAMTRRVEDYRTLLPGAQGSTPARHDRMPYRVFLGQIAERLRCTHDGRANGYEGPAQLRDDVALIADSLIDNRGLHAGYFQVRRLLARIDTFGFHLATLDLRQHTDVHHRVLAQGLDDPEWVRRPATERHARLLDVLERDVSPTGSFDAIGKRTLAVFDAIQQCRHRYGEEAIGLYIVGGTAHADDVLAPLVLARWADAHDKSTGEVALDLAPQFDSVETLDRCGEITRQLLDDAVYGRHLESRGRLQTIAIGYSNSNQESGIIASRHAAYQAQHSLTGALRQGGKEHVLFYTRGGSVARGGGRIDALLRAAPPESISGVLRFTEQGESISQNYGMRPNAMRTLERAFSSLALATLAVRRQLAVREDTKLAECAAVAAEHSRGAYRALVFDEPQLYAYFRAVTPIDVIERMQIGAGHVHPELRGVDAVRPEAWVYAWSQSRFMLPGWYGAGAGLTAAQERHGIALLRRCYQEWPFFTTLIDDVESVLARADLAIAACYERLAPPSLRPLGRIIRAEFDRSCAMVLAIKECDALLDDDGTMQRGIALRNPYVDPMNFMQIDLLERWRAGDRQDRELFEALLASVSGIARGVQTTG